MNVKTMDFDGEETTLAYIIAIIKRRRSLIVWPALVVFSIAVLAALLLPSKYQSIATILIEEQDVPRELVPSTMTGFADQQIQIINRRLMTIENISGIAEKFGLYRDSDGNALPSIKLVESFVEDMNMEPLGVEVVDPQSGRAAKATIAFTLSFVSDNPSTAQTVTNELVTMFMNENRRSRTNTAASTSQFLSEEARALENELITLEQKIAAFKQENEGSLPELFQFNFSVIERSGRELTELTYRLQELGKRELELAAELSQINPSATKIAPDGNTIMSDSDRLQYLESEFRRLSSVYQPAHPDVLAVKREIAELEAKLKGNSRGTAANNPAYVMLQTQLSAIALEQRSLKDKQTELRSAIAHYEGLVRQAPLVEKEYQALMRNYGNANQKYQDIKVKQREAEMAQNLEQERKGQRFVLLEPPSLPILPVKPNRPVIVVLGFILAAGIGFGLAFIKEVSDSGIYGDKALEKLMGVPVMAAVPYLENAQDKYELRLARRKAIIAGLVVVFVLFTIVFRLRT
jgi:succinoglycan biosynthesis transport protein ExoP